MSRSRLRFSAQVKDYVTSLPPDNRRKVREALRGLSEGRGDFTALGAFQPELEGFHRLKIPPWRLIFHHEPSAQGPVCVCDFMETRDIVYEVFAAILSEEGRL